MRTIVYLDEHSRFGPDMIRRLHLMPLIVQHCPEEVSIIYGLLLEPTGLLMGIFKRCGYFVVSDYVLPDRMFHSTRNAEWIEYESFNTESGQYTICIL
jgi:hypothetical protein